MQFMNVSVLPYLWPLLYLKSQDEKDPQSVKASIKVTKRSYFNKIRFRLPSSRSNMVSTTLQIETDLVSLDKVWKGKHSKKNTIICSYISYTIRLFIIWMNKKVCCLIHWPSQRKTIPRPEKEGKAKRKKKKKKNQTIIRVCMNLKINFGDRPNYQKYSFRSS